MAVELTDVGRCLLDATPAEYIGDDKIYDVSEGGDDQLLFGVTFGVIRKATRLNQIRRTDGVNCRPDQIEGAAFKRWANDHGHPLKPQPENALTIYQYRKRLAQETSDSEAGPVPAKSAGAIDSMFDSIERDATEGEEFDRKLQVGMTTAYRDLLPKRDAFDSGEELTLRSAIEGLKLAREDVENDIACLAEIEHQSQLAKTVKAKRDELAKAGEALKAAEARHKIELQEAKAAKRKAFNAQYEASAAPARIRDLQAKHPRLFGAL